MAKYELNYEAIDADFKKQHTDAEDLFEWVETIIIAFYVVILIFTFVLRIAVVSGGSMLPTLEDKDRLIVSYLFYNSNLITSHCYN